jgi:hypothetical protein
MDQKLQCKVKKLSWRFREGGDQGTLADVLVRSQEMDQKLRCKVKKLSWRFWRGDQRTL